MRRQFVSIVRYLVSPCLDDRKMIGAVRLLQGVEPQITGVLAGWACERVEGGDDLVAAGRAHVHVRYDVYRARRRLGDAPQDEVDRFSGPGKA